MMSFTLQAFFWDTLYIKAEQTKYQKKRSCRETWFFHHSDFFHNFNNFLDLCNKYIQIDWDKKHGTFNLVLIEIDLSQYFNTEMSVLKNTFIQRWKCDFKECIIVTQWSSRVHFNGQWSSRVDFIGMKWESDYSVSLKKKF